MAITRYDRHIRDLRETIQNALTKLSKIVVGHDNIHLELKPCIGAYTLSEIEPFVTDTALRTLTASVHNISPDMLDAKKLKRYQEALLDPKGTAAGPATVGHVSNAHDGDGGGQGIRNKPKMTPEQKTKMKADKNKT
jgi:hypothetical protein